MTSSKHVKRLRGMSRHILDKNMRRNGPSPTKNAAHFFAYGQKSAAHKEQGAASRTKLTARGKKNGIYRENVLQRYIFTTNLFYALVQTREPTSLTLTLSLSQSGFELISPLLIICSPFRCLILRVQSSVIQR